MVFITESNKNHIDGVRKVPYRKPGPAAAAAHLVVREFDAASRRADRVSATASSLKQLGLEPDIIIGHHGWGEMLHLPDIWPDVPLLGYFEFFYQTHAADVGFDPEFPSNPADYPRIRAKNAVNLLALNLERQGQTPTAWQLSTYPAWARQQITLLPEGVNLEVCKPATTRKRQPLTIGGQTIRPATKLVTYVSRDLEPYRGFHVMMRALPDLLQARKDVTVVMVGGDGVSYGNPPKDGTWRAAMLRELGDRIDTSRVIFPGRVDYPSFIALLQRSDAHVYLTYPFVASWSLREALAVGCAVIGSDTQPVREFITHDETGLLVSFFDPPGLAQTILRVLEDTALARRLRRNARRFAEANLSLTDTMAAYATKIAELTGS